MWRASSSATRLIIDLKELPGMPPGALRACCKALSRSQHTFLASERTWSYELRAIGAASRATALAPQRACVHISCGCFSAMRPEKVQKFLTALHEARQQGAMVVTAATGDATCPHCSSCTPGRPSALWVTCLPPLVAEDGCVCESGFQAQDLEVALRVHQETKSWAPTKILFKSAWWHEQVAADAHRQARLVATAIGGLPAVPNVVQFIGCQNAFVQNILEAFEDKPAPLVVKVVSHRAFGFSDPEAAPLNVRLPSRIRHMDIDIGALDLSECEHLESLTACCTEAGGGWLTDGRTLPRRSRGLHTLVMQGTLTEADGNFVAEAWPDLHTLAMGVWHASVMRSACSLAHLQLLTLEFPVGEHAAANLDELALTVDAGGLPSLCTLRLKFGHTLGPSALALSGYAQHTLVSAVARGRSRVLAQADAPVAPDLSLQVYGADDDQSLYALVHRNAVNAVLALSEGLTVVGTCTPVRERVAVVDPSRYFAMFGQSIV